MKAYALILAGGQGTRLGEVRKAALRLGGITLLERIMQRLGEATGPVLVSTGRGPNAAETIGINLPDLDLPRAGPLAGIVAAAAYLRERCEDDAVLISVAVDTPFLPPDYFDAMADALRNGAGAAQAAWRDSSYPTNAAWRLARLKDLPERVASGSAPQSPKGLLAELEAPKVDWQERCALDPFANINTLDDLIASARRLAEPDR